MTNLLKTLRKLDELFLSIQSRPLNFSLGAGLSRLSRSMSRNVVAAEEFDFHIIVFSMKQYGNKQGLICFRCRLINFIKSRLGKKTLFFGVW